MDSVAAVGRDDFARIEKRQVGTCSRITESLPEFQTFLYAARPLRGVAKSAPEGRRRNQQNLRQIVHSRYASFAARNHSGKANDGVSDFARAPVEPDFEIICAK